MVLHARRRLRQAADARRPPDGKGWDPGPAGAFPVVPEAARAPQALRDSLARDTVELLAGRWRAFGHLPIQVEDPPRWNRDYLAGCDVPGDRSAFQLNHRALPGGADIKLVWELSRWQALTRLAMAAQVLGHRDAGARCVGWLEDWVRHNPPYRGWNWTSALEVGMRLIQFTWIDALLSGPGSDAALAPRLAALRPAVLVPHVWYAWRHRSFGSSANNHLLGELAGLIVATARWPGLQRWGAPWADLQRELEREVLAQFAPDGGNREQALGYQLFSWELAWQARLALRAAGRPMADAVEERLRAAAAFAVAVQRDAEPWNYGDGDDAVALPVAAGEATLLAEWRAWLGRAPAAQDGAIGHWLGEAPAVQAPAAVRRGPGWRVFPESGLAVWDSPGWGLRWDVSPLGYLRTAAHGHLDALHLSIWRDGVALIIDPGTGAYYADPALRAWLASRAAHNGPCPEGIDFPRRLGPFLWSARHAAPVLSGEGSRLEARLRLPGATVRRQVTLAGAGPEWVVEDACEGPGGAAMPFTVRWQFAPGSRVRQVADRRWVVTRGAAALAVEAADGWATATLVERPVAGSGQEALSGVVSPAFRAVDRAPFLLLRSAGQGAIRTGRTVVSPVSPA
ncbi:MAG: hypothetical protein RJA22_1005 [Verrucomicrobiota bacterium]